MENILISTLIYFVGLCILSLTVIYISATIQFKSRKFDANVSFEKDKITIQHLNRNLVEEKNWDWISKSSKDKKAFYFEILNGKYGDMLFIPLSIITNEQADILGTWLKINSVNHR